MPAFLCLLGKRPRRNEMGEHLHAFLWVTSLPVLLEGQGRPGLARRQHTSPPPKSLFLLLPAGTFKNVIHAVGRIMFPAT